MVLPEQRLALVSGLQRINRGLQKTLDITKTLVRAPSPTDSEKATYIKDAKINVRVLTDQLSRYDTQFQDLSRSFSELDRTSVSSGEDISAQLDHFADIYEEAVTWKHSLMVQLEALEEPCQTAASTPGITTDGNLSRQLERMLDHFEQGYGRGAASTPVTPEPQIGNQPAGASSVAQTTSVKLPKLELIKFSGDFLKWKEFHDMFEATVHANPKLKPVEKLNYLLAQLSGDARAALSGIEISNQNYDVARKLLSERFGNPQVAVTTLHTKLRKMSSVPNSTDKLRTLYDEVESCLRSLQALGQDVESPQLVSLIMSKFPAEFLMNLERFKDPDQDWTVELLRKRFKAELSARETVDRIQDKQQICDEPKQADNRQRSSSGVKKQFNTGQALTASSTKADGFSKPKQCVFCNEGHWTDECGKYRTVAERKAQLKGRCFLCLSAQHQAKEYQFADSRQQNRAEASAVASDEVCKESEDAAASKYTKSSDDPTLLAVGGNVLLQTATIEIKSFAKSQVKQHRALLDTGSTRSYITEQVAGELKLKTRKGPKLALSRFATGKIKQVSTRIADIEIQLKDGGSMLLTVNIVPSITGKIHRTPISRQLSSEFLWKHLPLADNWPSSEENLDIGLLIGMDYYLDIVTTDKIQAEDGLHLIGSKLGWILTGRIDESSISNNKLIQRERTIMAITSMRSSEPAFEFTGLSEDYMSRPPSLEDWWSLDAIGIKDSPDENADDKALESFSRTVKMKDKRYQVTWPWIDDQVDLPNNFELSKGRLRSLLGKLNRNTQFLSDYDQIIQSQIEKEVVEPVGPNSECGPRQHYIPHHAVITPQKTTTKIRIVYDASAKTRKDNPSLNECLFRGPVFLQNLCGLLMRFRLYKIVLLSDIEKAFLQIGLQPADRDVARFLWLKDKDKPMSDDNIQVMRFCRVPFGVISSPFLLGATVDYHLKKNSSPIAEEIRRGIYVDNVLLGASSLEEAREIYKRSKSIFAEASMNLREWTSNSQEFLSSIPECDRVALGITKVLGIRWNTTEDVITLQQVDSNKANTIPGPDLVLRSSAWQAKVETKREVLKFLAQYFDPLGYYLPVTVRGKLLLRTLWDDGLHWDDKLLPKHSEQWEVLKKDLAEIQNHTLPRLVLSEHTQVELSLLCFVDASQSVYATAVYLHTCSHDNVITNLIFAKSRLSPKKLISIPRLELMAVLIGIRSIAFVEKELRLRVKQKILWSDSQCALH